MTAVLASIEALTVRAGPATILRSVTLEIPKGAIVGIVGESGSGKSTLGAALMGMLAPGLVAEGRIGFDGRDLLQLSPRAMRGLRGRTLAMIAQDPMTALNPLFTVGTHLTDVARRRRTLSRTQARAAGERMLHRVGIADPALRMASYPHQLSGGMRQRVAIAMALLAEPALLIADEPTTALDATVEAQIAALFAGLRREMAGSIVFISHHLGLVAQLCDRICVLYGGTVVETGTAAAVTREPKHPYTQALLDCEIDAEASGPLRFIPGRVPDPAAPPPGCIFAPAAPAPNRAAATGCPRWQRRRRTIAPPASWCRMPETLLAAEDVRVRFGAAEVIAGASLALGVGEVVGLVGESGSGKTTLCRAMLGLQPLAAGRVSLDGRPLAGCPPARSAAARSSCCRTRPPRSRRACGCARCWPSRSASTACPPPLGPGWRRC